jgi:acetyl esterase/lipase
MKKLLLPVTALLLISACQGNFENTSPPGLAPTIEITDTPIQEPTAIETKLPTGTATEMPTETPTQTPTSTITRTPTPDVKDEIVRFQTEDGVTIVGNLVGEGQVGVVLAHMGEAGSNSRRSWMPFAKHIADRGLVTALAIDLRGYGNSVASPSFTKQSLDVSAAINFLKEQGYTRIVCMGASMGGNACVEASLQNLDLVGLAVIASNPFLDRDYSVLSMPKLFVLEQGDPYGLTDRMTAVFELMPEPKEYHTFPEEVHGTRMFKTDSGDEFRSLLIDFIESFAE